MKLEGNPALHLTYCSNVHPGEEWDEHFGELKTWIPPLRERLAPDAPFGLGVRISDRAARDLLKEGRLEKFSDWMKENGLYLFTINGFPYGQFHRGRVKEQVYEPDWSTDQRLEYTLNLTRILEELLPEGVDGGISTSPLGYKYGKIPRPVPEAYYRECCHRLAEVAWQMHLVEQRSGRELHLDIEPEPDCILEQSRETVVFFTEKLFPVGSMFMSREKGVSPAAAEAILRRHVRICYDTCHLAVGYEEPEEAIGRILREGIGIGKVQISAALKAKSKSIAAERFSENISRFDEPVYLHQVVERRSNGTLCRYRDLPEALSRLGEEGEGRARPEEWRVHFHLPVYRDRFGELETTRDQIEKGLPVLLEQSGCSHYEVETYTWEVLPGPAANGREETGVQRAGQEGQANSGEHGPNLLSSLERELRWACGQIIYNLDRLREKR